MFVFVVEEVMHDSGVCVCVCVCVCLYTTVMHNFLYNK